MQLCRASASAWPRSAHRPSSFALGLSSSARYRLLQKLGLGGNVTAADLKAAFRTKAKALHPDVVGSSSSATELVAQFADVKAASEALLHDLAPAPGADAEVDVQSPVGSGGGSSRSSSAWQRDLRVLVVCTRCGLQA
jgi:hypothetical protein